MIINVSIRKILQGLAALLLIIVVVALAYKKSFPGILVNDRKIEKRSESAVPGKESSMIGDRPRTIVGKRPREIFHETITPEIAETLIIKASAITNVLEQASAYRDIIKQLCEAGYTDEAWRLIIAEPGYNRDSQLWAFFSSANLDSKTSIDLIDNLFDSKEKQISLQSFLSKNHEGFPSILEDAGFKKIIQDLAAVNPNALMDVVGNGLRLKLDDAENNAEKEKINNIILDFYSKGMVSDDVLATILIRNKGKNPFDLWSWISDSSMGVGQNSGIAADVRKGVIQEMVFENPTKALSQISSASGESGDQDLFFGLTQWAENNPKAASDWYFNQQANLTESQRDHAAKAFATSALSYGEVDGAESWANQITNSEIRNAILKKIHPSLPEGE